MKALFIATTLALLEGSTANAGSVIDFIGSSRLKVRDCGTDTCGTISLGKRKFVVKKSDISALIKDLNIGDVLSSMKERDKIPATADRAKPAQAASAEDRNVTASRSEELAVIQPDDRPAPRNEERPRLTTVTKDAVAPLEQKVVVAAPAPAPVVSDPRSPVGEWITEGGEGRVRIRPCGQALCGVIATANPNETDRQNPDASKRNRPLLGLPVLIDMMPTKEGRWEGQVYNAKSGNTYASSITLKSADVLRVEGCVLGGMFCNGQNWTRANDTPQG